MFRAKLTAMTTKMLSSTLITLLFGLLPDFLSAQSFDLAGTRAAGMAGAFVGVADDASAVYWNPAGAASGSYFSLLLDAGARRAAPSESLRGGDGSSFFLAATMPALGLSYYRLRSAYAGPDTLLLATDGTPSSREVLADTQIRLDSIVTHHAGLTLVQSIVPNVAVGATLKLVRGIATSGFTASATARDALEQSLPAGRGTTRFDADLGVMATGRKVKAGLTLRNLREPTFTSAEGRALTLDRQARAGVSYALTPGLLVAADLDLLESRDAFGTRRDAAIGVEGRVGRRATVRSGFKVNAAGADGEGGAGSGRAFTVGGSFAATAAVFVDAVAITGSERSGRGWGVAARFVY